MGVRGWIAALDLATGKQLWRAYNLGPDSDMKVGPRFKPFYPQDRGTNLGVVVVAGRLVEGGRRGGVGLDLVRSRAQPRLPRHVESRDRGTAISVPATTSGARRSSRAMPTPAR